MAKNPSLAGRAVLAIVLMVGFYVLALGICAALAFMVFADFQGRLAHGKVRGDARLEPAAIGRALTEGKLLATEWSETCARHAIADMMIAGPVLPIAS